MRVVQNSPKRLLDGGNEPSAEPVALAAGPLSVLWDNGGLRYVRLGQSELVRRVYSAVRDANWGTVPDRISDIRLTRGEDAFRIEFDVHNLQAEIDFAWHGSIAGEPSGRIVFAMEGIANSTFRRNRVGFCILHPMQLAGTPVEIRHADGSNERSEFPRFIAPDNPFLDVVALRHTAGPGAELQIACEGDVFETEDQRNWSDASFKTFCTPLSKPFPVVVAAGERISQQIIIELFTKKTRGATVQLAQTQAVVLELGTKAIGPLPKIGFGIAAEAEPLTASQVRCLRRLKPAHLRCELRMPGDFSVMLPRAAKTAADLDAELDAVLFLGDDAERELKQVPGLLDQVPVKVARWTLFQQAGWSTMPELIERFSGYLRRLDASIPIGGGTPASFCELNRCRPPSEMLDFVTWSMQPQEHAFDNASLIETLAAQAATVASARQFTAGLPLVVGPITLKKRINPYATGAWPPQPAMGELPLQVDVRQATLFGAGWTLGSIKYLAESGVQAVTYYELVGWKGLIETEAGSPLPDIFPSLPGSVFPLYHVFADLAEFTDALVVPVQSSAPLDVEALALTLDRAGRPTCALLANLSPKQQRVVLPTAAHAARVRLLAESNVLEAITAPESYRQRPYSDSTVRDSRLEIDLSPFALARVDLQ